MDWDTGIFPLHTEGNNAPKINSWLTKTIINQEQGRYCGEIGKQSDVHADVPR